MGASISQPIQCEYYAFPLLSLANIPLHSIAIFDVLKASPTSFPLPTCQCPPIHLIATTTDARRPLPTECIHRVVHTSVRWLCIYRTFRFVILGSKENQALSNGVRQQQTIAESHDPDDEVDEFQSACATGTRPRCIVGVHKLSAGEAVPQIGRWNRLLDTPRSMYRRRSRRWTTVSRYPRRRIAPRTAYS